MSQSNISAALYDLGLKMKQYVQFYIIALIFTVIGSIIFAFSIVSSLDMSGSNDVSVIIIPLVFFITFIITIAIWGLVRFFRFLKAIKNAANATLDLNLDKGYRYQIYAIIISVLTAVGIIIFILILIGTSNLNNAFFLDNFMASLPTLSTIITVAAIAPVIFNIMAYVALYNWAEQISFSLQNYYGGEIKQGFNFMKWGTIIQVVFGGAYLLVLIGMYKAAGALLNQYNPQGVVEPPINGQYSQTSYAEPNTYGIPPENKLKYAKQPFSSSNPTQSNKNLTSPEFCRNCGYRLSVGPLKFCPQCGFQIT